MRQRGCGDDFRAKPPEQHEVGRHHGDLTELRERNRCREPDRIGQLSVPKAQAGRGMRARRESSIVYGHAAFLCRPAKNERAKT